MATSKSKRRNSDRALPAGLVPEHKTRPSDAAARLGRTRGANKQDLLELMRAQKVRFLRLQFSDISGIIKNVEVPQTQFEKALSGDIMFDGSSIEGFVRVEESDMVL